MKIYESDEKYINPETLFYFCNTNESLLTAPPRAFVVEFPGLGGNSCMYGDMQFGAYTKGEAEFLAKHGVLLCYVFPGPWSWMNCGAVRLTNAVVRAIRKKYALPQSAPWCVMGGSMGGLGALNYVRCGETQPNACIAVCPCVDVPAAVFAHQEFPRTFFRAVSDYDCTIEEGLLTLSPMAHIEEMPDIPYLIVNDCADEVFPEQTLDTYVQKLTGRVSRVRYDKLPGLPHGAITPEEWQAIRAFLAENLGISL